MKTDAFTGTFTLEDGLVLGATTTRVEFLSSPTGQGSSQKRAVVFIFFTVLSPALAVAAYFKGEDLDSTHFAVMDRYSKTEWSAENEMARKKANNDWLRSVDLNPGSSYFWRTVWSDYDPRSGSSGVMISYARS